MEKINKAKSWFFENIKIETFSFLDRPRKKEKIQIIKVKYIYIINGHRNKKG